MTFLSRKTLLAATITVAAIGTGFGALASSHREAPHITKYPQEDGTDFYMFNSYEDGREDFVTILANYNPIQAGFADPNYFLLDNAAHDVVGIVLRVVMGALCHDLPGFTDRRGDSNT